MKIPLALFLSPLALASGFLHAEESVPKPKAIVLIYADDLGFGDLSSYGAKKIQTPAMDSMAKAGIRFTDAHSPAACCSPSRYAMLTGEYAWRTSLKKGVLGPQAPLLIKPDQQTLASFLKSQGYTTGIVGKWHLGLGNPPETEWNNEPIKPGPNEVGFDYSYIVAGSPNFPPTSYIENGKVVGRQPGETVKLMLPPNGHPARWKMKEVSTISQNRINWRDSGIQLAAKAVEYIESHADQPFFLYFSTPQVHLPIRPNARFRGSSQAGQYGDYVKEFDFMVGEVLTALERKGLSKDSLVILTSDNGASVTPTKGTGHNPNGTVLRGYKSLIYEGGHRVPFLVQWPEVVPADKVSNAPVNQVDLLASLHALFGVPVPEGAAPDSLDVLPALLGQVDVLPDRVMINHSTAGVFAIRKGDWKLIEGITYVERRDGKPPVYELYNLKDDPSEKNDLAASSPEMVKDLAAKLVAIRGDELQKAGQGDAAIEGGDEG